jgi:hypothetical protein
MAKTSVVYPTVGQLREWLRHAADIGGPVPNDWTIHQKCYGFEVRDPSWDSIIGGPAFSLVPEDEEDE